MHNAPAGRVVSIRPGRLPGEQKAALSVRSTESFDRGDIGSQLELLERHFSDVGWEAPRLLRAARTAPDFYLDSMGQVLLGRWSRGRVVLLGDAGYCPSPLTGLGTSLALVGAYILAGELAAASADATAASDLQPLRGPDAPVRQAGPGAAAGGRGRVRPDERAAHRPRLGLDALVAALADATHDGAGLQQGRCH
jgi:2-polyprenyl-6-methoxyphenol hydroxylase-like FAD-dependent oxidoreductase